MSSFYSSYFASFALPAGVELRVLEELHYFSLRTRHAMFHKCWTCVPSLRKEIYMWSTWVSGLNSLDTSA